jgi:hypothetical protein
MTTTGVTPSGDTDAVYIPYKKETIEEPHRAPTTTPTQVGADLSAVTVALSFSSGRQLTQASVVDPLAQIGSSSTFGEEVFLQMMQLNIGTPFPSPPVGVGARWRVRFHDPNEDSANVTTTYTLRSFAGGRYRLDFSSVEQPRLPALLPSLLPGNTTEIVGYTNRINGSLKGSLHQLVPLEATATRVFTQRVRDNSGGKPVFTDSSSHTVSSLETSTEPG